jgi:hypothetical protein
MAVRGICLSQCGGGDAMAASLMWRAPHCRHNDFTAVNRTLPWAWT